jgi:hypothetical protein
MKHWMKQYPEKILIINYERYIADQETETRRMTGLATLIFMTCDIHTMEWPRFSRQKDKEFDD